MAIKSLPSGVNDTEVKSSIEFASSVTRDKLHRSLPLKRWDTVPFQVVRALKGEDTPKGFGGGQCSARVSVTAAHAIGLHSRAAVPRTRIRTAAEMREAEPPSLTSQCLPGRKMGMEVRKLMLRPTRPPGLCDTQRGLARAWSEPKSLAASLGCLPEPLL